MKPLDPMTLPLLGTRLIEASAGTGKTYTIATLVLRTLIERSLPLRQILVVTFTKAAAAELRDRVRRRLAATLAAIELGAGFEDDPALQSWLQHRIAAGHAEADRRALAEALRDFDEAAICTIHAFCQRVLTEHAFESRVAFDAELLEEQAPLLEEIAIDYWATTAYAAAPELARQLAGRAGLPRLHALAVKAVRNPEMPVLPEACDAPALEMQPFERAREKAAQIYREERATIIELLCRPLHLKAGSYPSEVIRHEWAEALEHIDAWRPGSMAPFAARLTPAALQSGTRKNKPVPEHAFFRAMGELCEAAAAIESAIANQLLEVRRGLVEYTRRELGARRQKLGVQGFDDLLVQLKRALAGEAGAQLRTKLLERHPVALIDEFQDTDPIQYDIFRGVYGDAGTLFLIGDPKQAIYGFRGADVFAYLKAARDAGEGAYTLGVNHRSDPRLIHAVDTLFSRCPRPFLFPEIEFHRVTPKRDAREHMSSERPALELWFVPRSYDGNQKEGRPLTKQWAMRTLPGLVASEIVRLLHEAPRVGDEPLKPRHLAVLCRTNAQAKLVARELGRLGVPTVLDGDSSVFESEMADELAHVLAAIAHPGDRRKLGAALASSLCGVSARALHDVQTRDAALDTWLERMARWNTTWHERGFTRMWHDVMDDAQIRTHLLARVDGERRLTDLLHLSELLHEVAVTEHLGPLSLLQWFAQMRDDAARHGTFPGEATQLRLEHDEHALRLTTIHRSKGLEYPFVVCPFSWSESGKVDDDICFHDERDGDRLKLDLGSSEQEAHKDKAARETLAENLRLLYVALTRAKHRCAVVYGRFNQGGKSALAYLLHHRTEGEPALDAVEAHLAARADAELQAELGALANASEGTLGLRELPLEPARPYALVEAPRGALAARVASRMIVASPRMTSFSRLTAPREGAVDPESIGALSERDHADDQEDELGQAQSGDVAREGEHGRRVLLADFPRGAGPGSMIHAVFEHIDFRREDALELSTQVQRLLPAFGLSESHAASLCDAIADVLRTRLVADPHSPAFALADIARTARRAELEFLLCARPDTPQLCVQLAAAFERHAAPACAPEYAERLRNLRDRTGARFLRGFIDLVFRHEGRYYIVDYKSNHLGDTAQDYRPGRLLDSMQSHHYVLQYHLYALALHRHLGLRLSNYDYERDFGGVYYLFVRGMSERHPAGTGVFFDRPTLALLEDLSSALGADRSEA